MTQFAQSFQDMEVYQESILLQQEIFKTTKQLPADERFSLTDQIRRSSRSIGANIAESWAKRRYPAHFLSKLTDADGELQETLHWIHSAIACSYLSES
jgi:four helix bundle protein